MIFGAIWGNPYTICDTLKKTIEKSNVQSVHYTRHIRGLRCNPCNTCDTLEMAGLCVAYNVRIEPEAPNVPCIVYGLHMQFWRGLR